MALFFRQLKKYFQPSTVPVCGTRLVKRPGTKNSKSIKPLKRMRQIPAYVLVLDESGSTATTFRVGFGRTTTRTDAIRGAAQNFLHQLSISNPRQLVGLIGFSDTARLYHPLAPVTLDQRSVSKALERLRSKGSTNLSAGVAKALDQLKRAGTNRGNIIVVTDGAANMDKSRLPGLIRQAQTMRVRIFTIGIGNNKDSDYDRELLEKMARTTGGRFDSAFTLAALERALRKVS